MGVGLRLGLGKEGSRLGLSFLDSTFSDPQTTVVSALCREASISSWRG